MPYLELNGERHALQDSETVIGSGAKATLRLPNVDLAGRHFTIAPQPAGGAKIESCSPHHVVVVNGRQLTTEPIVLREGDVIAAGSATFLYCDDPSRAVQPRYQAGAPSAFLVNERERRAYSLGRRSASIGRDTASHIHIAEPTISRFHADIRAEAGEYVLYSLGSAGTQVNGERVAVPRVLAEGDRIELGDTSLVFTRNAPPNGIELRHEGDDYGSSPISERPTVAHARMDDVNEKPKSGVPMLAVVVGLVVVALAAWLVIF